MHFKERQSHLIIQEWPGHVKEKSFKTVLKRRLADKEKKKQKKTRFLVFNSA